MGREAVRVARLRVGLITLNVSNPTKRFVWSARIAKSGKIVRELLEVDASSIPPGSGFETRHAAKLHGKRRVSARPAWLADT
jgi:hypothetical protein